MTPKEALAQVRPDSTDAEILALAKALSTNVAHAVFYLRAERDRLRAEAWPGCCSGCSGTGSWWSPETGGRCPDCRGTGCAHPEPLCTSPPPISEPPARVNGTIRVRAQRSLT